MQVYFCPLTPRLWSEIAAEQISLLVALRSDVTAGYCIHHFETSLSKGRMFILQSAGMFLPFKPLVKIDTQVFEGLHLLSDVIFPYSI